MDLNYTTLVENYMLNEELHSCGRMKFCVADFPAFLDTLPAKTKDEFMRTTNIRPAFVLAPASGNLYPVRVSVVGTGAPGELRIFGSADLFKKRDVDVEAGLLTWVGYKWDDEGKLILRITQSMLEVDQGPGPWLLLNSRTIKKTDVATGSLTFKRTNINHLRHVLGAEFNDSLDGGYYYDHPQVFIGGGNGVPLPFQLTTVLKGKEFGTFVLECQMIWPSTDFLVEGNIIDLYIRQSAAVLQLGLLPRGENPALLNGGVAH